MAKNVKIFANCKKILVLNPCKIFYMIFSTAYYLLSLFLSLKKNTRWKKKFKLPNTRQQPKNFEMKSCRAAEFSKFVNFSLERKAGRASIAGGCLGGSLTEVLGSENPLPSLIVSEFFKNPSSSHGKKIFHSFRHISG